VTDGDAALDPRESGRERPAAAWRWGGAARWMRAKRTLGQSGKGRVYGISIVTRVQLREHQVPDGDAALDPRESGRERPAAAWRWGGAARWIRAHPRTNREGRMDTHPSSRPLSRRVLLGPPPPRRGRDPYAPSLPTRRAPRSLQVIRAWHGWHGSASRRCPYARPRGPGGRPSCRGMKSRQREFCFREKCRACTVVIRT
jgi:hypothetical protein